MIAHALTTTSALAVVCILAKLLEPHTGSYSHGVDLLQLCLHWKEVAEQDQDNIVQFQHLVTAQTFLAAARTTNKDDELERSVGVDVSRLSRELNRSILRSRGNFTGEEA